MVSLIAEFRGEVAALGAALIWAIASVIYAGVGRQITPLVLNLVKGGIAIALLILTLLWQNNLWPAVNPQALLLLLLSGAVGIGLGDTAYFAALNHIGPRRTLVLEALAPPLAAMVALATLQEYLPLTAWLGILITVTSVTWVVLERTPSPSTVRQRPSLEGIGFGLIAAGGQASGAVLSRAALANTAIDPLWSSLVRVVAGVLVLLLWMVVQRQSAQKLQPLQSPRLLTIIIVTAFFTTYLAIWMQQISLKYAAVGVAQALSATSPLFVLPLAIASGERISRAGLFGMVLACFGIWLLFNR